MEVIQTKEQWVLHRLTQFYANEYNFQRVRAILEEKSRISLRLLDWLVTNYAKKYNVSYITKQGGRHCIVYLAYKSHLKAYRKVMFDPFCRTKHIQFRGLDTTVGQLNFFEWVLQDEVLDYLEDNYDAVHADMEANAPESRVKNEGEETRRKRRELSRSATKSICHYDVRVPVKFD